MKFEEALKLAETERGKFDCGEVYGVRDCDDRWAFFFVADQNVFGAASMFVFKETGEFEYFFIGDYCEMLRAGKQIPLPESE